MMPDADQPVEKKARVSRPSHVLMTPDGQKMKAKAIDKFFRDVLGYWHGANLEGKALVTRFDPENPLGPEPLVPSERSPICAKCGLFESGARHPFMPYFGPAEPVVTIVYEGVTPPEDDANQLSYVGNTGAIRRALDKLLPGVGLTHEQVRWVPMTRCAARSGKKPDIKIKGNWCRYHVVEDLLFHPPQVIIPVGSAVLGLLCHKSNVQDWQGRTLTYRGWPDDWLTKPEFMLPREDPLDETKTVVGHPIFGKAPADFRIPMVPVQTPRLVFAAQNPFVYEDWKKAIKRGLEIGKSGTRANVYTRKWYRFVNDPDAVENGLLEMMGHPGMLVCYDTETTGLKGWAEDAAIVSMMFRWVDPDTKEPRSLGFPWNFRSDHFDNKVVDHIARLTPLVIEVLTHCQVVAHNATFDALYTYATLKNPNLDGLEPGSREHNLQVDRNLCALADAFKFDTWHECFAYRQQRGTLGLEAITYDYAPKMADYEEDMALLIELLESQLFPGHKDAKGRPTHYLNIAEEYYPTHVVPYVMGDVESCYTAQVEIEKKLAEAKTYKIPLANPNIRGRFRWFQTPGRSWMYTKIMSPAARTLIKVMGRGMHVDEPTLTKMEGGYPKMVRKSREALKMKDERIAQWVEGMEAQDPAFELDLENKTHLKTILFDILNLPKQRLTKQGRKIFGETPEEWQPKLASGEMTEEDLYRFAALDKFTLNKLAVDHKEVWPLQEYRHVYKLYSTYIRTLRNMYTEGIDKKRREGTQHLCPDGRIHASFMMTGTRGGRLSCREPNLQQLPNKGDVKQMFTSRFGARGCMYQADLSQIELRLMAAACGDPTMIQAYLDKVDLHTLTTSRIFKLPYENFSKEYFKWLQDNKREKEAKELELKRRIGKTVNFLTGYGGGAFGLQTTLANSQVYLPLGECEQIIAAFFESYPSLKEFLKYYKRFIQDNRVAVSVFGRVRIFEEVAGQDLEAKSKALRAGCNHIIQSTASDMMLISLIVIEALMREAGLESILVSTVHDSLLIDAVRDELPVIHDIVSPVLNNFHEVLPVYFGGNYDTSWMLVPFAGDCEVGPSYYDTRKIPDKDIDWDKLLAVEA